MSTPVYTVSEEFDLLKEKIALLQESYQLPINTVDTKEAFTTLSYEWAKCTDGCSRPRLRCKSCFHAAASLIICITALAAVGFKQFYIEDLYTGRKGKDRIPAK